MLNKTLVSVLMMKQLTHAEWKHVFFSLIKDLIGLKWF